MAGIDDVIGSLQSLTIRDVISEKYRSLKEDVVDVVSWDKKDEGETKYSRWAKNNFTWTYDDYNHEGFRAVYCEKQFENRARLVVDALEAYKAAQRRPLFVGPKLNSNPRVVSFGCGPGNDLTGFEAFFEKEKQQLQNKLERLKQLPSKTPNEQAELEEIKGLLRRLAPTYTGYDSVEGWEAYVKRLRYDFRCEGINKRFIQTMPNVDVVILCYFAHSANFSEKEKETVWEEKPNGRRVSKNKRLWDYLAEKCKMIIVLDVNDPLQNNCLNKRKYWSTTLKDDNCCEVHVHIWLKPSNIASYAVM